jgi:hypothetical protein
MKLRTDTLRFICIFSIAMAALEAAVVVYLRALYYPDGFDVTFKLIDERIVAVEIAREAATLVMLGAIACIAGKDGRERFAWFLISFAVWDIFYYAWLKVFIDWPQTIFDWDILFLIPITWIGPIAAPLVCCISMIFLGITLLRWKLSISKLVWMCILAGVALTLYTFMRDYASLILTNNFLSDYPNLLSNQLFLEKAGRLVPKPFLWSVFLLGQVLIISGIALLLTSKRLEPGPLPAS